MARNSYAEVETSSLVASDYNPNTLGKAEFDALVQEVENNQRLMKPVIVRVRDGQHVIVDGHFNWAAARVVGLPTVPIEIIEAGEFEARRQTIIRNRTGRKDNLLLGRCYRDMLDERNVGNQQFSNRELADTLGISEGSVRNQLLYPEAWELLREHADRCTNAGQPISPEAYVWHGRIYTERASELSTGAAADPVSKLGVRDLRALVASLQGLADDEEQGPGAAEAEARILARLKRAWNKATDLERFQFLEWTGWLNQGAPERNGYAEPTLSPPEPTDDRQMDIEHLTGDAPPLGQPEPTQEFAEEMAGEMPQTNGELRNGYADDPVELGRRVREARIARNWTQGELAEAAGTHGPIISQIENGKLRKVGKATLQRVTDAVL
jgi:DNA-binding XRE family transcriptional regulator